MDDDAASGHSGHVLSYLGGLSGSDEEDIENQLPFGNVASDGSGDVDGPASSSESSCDEDPMQAEGSMMEEVRALAEYAMPSDLVAHPLTGAMSPPVPIGANDGIDNYTSAALAKAAMLMPVSMDLYSVFKEPDTPKYLVGLRRGILTMITLFVLITCASMHFVLEIYTASMRAEIISACSDALSLQNLGADEIVYENITSEKMKQVLGSMTQRLSVSIQTPADRALESIWGSLRTMHVLNETWDGSIQEYKDQILYRIFVEFDTQWAIQDGPFASDDMAVSEIQHPTNQLKSISILRNSGEVIGMAGSFYSVSCPRSGPAVCGSCVGECKDLDVHAFGSLEGPHGKQLVRRKVNLSTGLPVGQPLLVEPLEWRQRVDYQVQKQAAQEAGATGAEAISRRWSRIYHDSKRALRMSWTQPLAYCGSYSCFDGVISAEVLLDHISHECKSGLSRLNGMTRPDATVTAANASIFVVNHVSQHRDQLGLLLGSAEWQDPERDYLPRNASDLQTHEPEQEMVAATARALFAKFGAWDAEALLEPQELSFRKSYALKGEFVECGFHRINYDFADGQDMDCLQVATKSVEFDKFTRWLIVTAVSAGAFNAHALAAQQGAFAMLESIDSIAQTSMNQARIAAAVIFFTVGFVALLIGAERMGMPTMSLEMFQSALTRVTLANLDFVPPYGSGASLYLRPFMVGSGPQLGLGASSEFTFIVVVAPVGPYYGSAVPAIVVEDYDRAAPNGVGQVKCAGNYAADIVPAARAKKQGFPVCLYLDAKEHRYVEEFSTSNFVAITKSGVYLTPDSVSVLDSVTNASLEKLAVDMGLKVERRKIDFDAEVDSFKEVGAVGTGVVITVIESITRDSKVYKFEQSEVLQNMYNKLRAIQTGDEADVHGWMRDIA